MLALKIKIIYLNLEFERKNIKHCQDAGNERNHTAGGRSMGVIADKIKENKSFYKLLFVEEICYINVIVGLFLGFATNLLPRFLTEATAFFAVVFFFVMCLIHIIFFISSFFHFRFKIMRKNAVLFFLFRLILIFMFLIFFAHFE